MDSEEKTETMLGSYRILDLTGEEGLMCGQLLGSFGADVIKIEKPSGDPARNIGPFYHDIPDPEKSLFWFAFNTNKRGITLNIEMVDGQEILKKLVETADVVIESFTPGYMDKLGLGYSELEKINRGIIMTSISPFGQTGPYKNLKASDLVCWAIGGALFTCGSFGRPPMRVSHVPQSFLVASTDAAWGTMMALYWRRISGEGQHVDVSIQESVERVALSSHVVWRSTGSSFQWRGSNYSVLPVRPEAPRTIWSCKDGYLACHIFTGEMGAQLNPPLIQWMSEEGQADEYLTGIDWAKVEWDNLTKEEVERIEECYARFFKTKTRAEILEGANQRRAMIQPVYGAKDILEHPQLKFRCYWQELEHRELDVTITYPGGFCWPSDTICKVWCRAPLIGEHNLEIYHGELGFSKKKLAILKQGGII